MKKLIIGFLCFLFIICSYCKVSALSGNGIGYLGIDDATARENRKLIGTSIMGQDTGDINGKR